MIALSKACPHCGGTLIEDAAEEITMNENEIIIDAFLAIVCENDCGFVERLD